MDEGKIGNIEMTCLIVNALGCKAFFTSVAVVIEKVGTAGWYMTLISMSVSMGAFYFIYMLIKAYPGKDILEIYDETAGKGIGRILSLISCLILLSSVSITLREFTDATNVYLLHETPSGFIVALFIIGMAAVCFLGIEGLGRVAKLFSYVLFFNFLLVIALSYRRFRTYRLFPLLGYGLGRTVKNGIIRSSAYGEIILVGIFAKALNDTKDVGKIGRRSLLLGGGVISLILLSVTISFPYFVARELADPLYIMVSLIDFGRFFQRVEVIFIFTWNLSTLIGLTAIFYGAVNCYAHTFDIKDKKPIIISFALLLYTLALIVPSISIILDYVVPSLRDYGWAGFYMPALLAWTMWFFFKRRKQTDAQKN